MAVKLSRRSYEYAMQLIRDGHAVYDDRDDWSEHRPSAQEENDFIERHGIDEFAKWHLAIDDDARPDTKGHYKFPYGDFRDVHRCALLSAESRAAQNDYADVRNAAAHLHGMLEASPSRR